MGALVKKTDGQSLLKAIKKFTDQTSSQTQSGFKPKVGLARSLQIAIMFDTTGSMYGYLQTVRRNLTKLISDIKAKVSDVKFAVIAYGDHCDAGTTYVTKVCQFTSDVEVVKKFVENVEPTCGGDMPEAMEDALRDLSQLDWNYSQNRCAILVGDAPPHGAMDALSECPFKIDYKVEVEKMASKNVKIYSVLCNNYAPVEEVFRWIAEKTKGLFLRLEKMEDLVDLIVGVCAKETGGASGLDSFIKDLNLQGKLTTSKERLLLALKAGG